jgi:hypothetical protein
VSISSTTSTNDTTFINKLLALRPDTNTALAWVDTASGSEVTDQWTFFGTMLTYQSTRATFQAVPTTDDKVYQIYWISDPASAPAGSVPVVLKQSAPTGPAKPSVGGQARNVEMKKIKTKRAAIGA